MESQMTPSFALLFFLRTSRHNAKGEAAIYCRITVNSQRAEISVQRWIDPTRWNSHGGYAKGTKEDARSLNHYIDTIKYKLNDIHSNLIRENKQITAESIKNIYLGKEEKQWTVIQVFEYHNSQMKERIGMDVVKVTWKKFETALRHVREFIRHQHQRDDLRLSELNVRFLNDFEHYLKTIRKCNHNSSLKYIRMFRKTVNIAVANDWLVKDPFLGFKRKHLEVKRGYLTEEELNSIESKEFHMPRVDRVRDVFVFCCYTGLAYSDVRKLSADNIVTGINGEKWIIINRTKTDTQSRIPVLPKAMEIIQKYKNDPECSDSYLLPVKSNQKMNAYLKEIADLCEITKNLTFHLARHTFATTLTLTNHVPIESVSSMLGHKSIKTTQIYAKVVDVKVSEDMHALKLRLADKPHNKKLQSNG